MKNTVEVYAVEDCFTKMCLNIARIVKETNAHLLDMGGTENLDYMVAFHNVIKSVDTMIGVLQDSLEADEAAELLDDNLNS